MKSLRRWIILRATTSSACYKILYNHVNAHRHKRHRYGDYRVNKLIVNFLIFQGRPAQQIIIGREPQSAFLPHRKTFAGLSLFQCRFFQCLKNVFFSAFGAYNISDGADELASRHARFSMAVKLARLIQIFRAVIDFLRVDKNADALLFFF